MLNDYQLQIILTYSYNMSRRVCHNELPGHDGSMADFFDNLATQISNGSDIDIDQNEFQSNVFDRMVDMVEGVITNQTL